MPSHGPWRSAPHPNPLSPRYRGEGARGRDKTMQPRANASKLQEKPRLLAAGDVPNPFLAQNEILSLRLRQHLIPFMQPAKNFDGFPIRPSRHDVAWLNAGCRLDRHAALFDRTGRH